MTCSLRRFSAYLFKVIDLRISQIKETKMIEFLILMHAAVCIWYVVVYIVLDS
jgi:hypothetical protein